MLMLLGRDITPLNFTIFDIGHDKYTKPCMEYIKTKFIHVNFEFIIGNSIIKIPKWINKNKELIGTYDVVYIDGGHSEKCILNDLKNTDKLIKINGLVIVDDTDAPQINKYVDLYISNGNYIEIDILKSFGYPHRVIKKIK